MALSSGGGDIVQDDPLEGSRTAASNPSISCAERFQLQQRPCEDADLDPLRYTAGLDW